MKVVGVLANYFIPERVGASSVFGAYYVNKEYFDIFQDYDVLAISIPYENNLEKLKKFISLLDGVVLTGGFDIPSDFFNEKVLKGPKYTLDRNRVSYELKLLELLEGKNLPILGICMGIQVYNIYKGGSLYQDLYSQLDTKINHSLSSADGRLISHTVSIKKNTKLHKIFKSDEIEVNSSHHQSIKDLGDGLVVSAFSLDGVVEAIESLDNSFIGVQWHPEALQSNKFSKALFESFISDL